MKVFSVFFMLCIATGLLLAQGGITGTANVTLNKPQVSIYGLPVTFGVQVDLTGVSGNEAVGLGGFALPVGYPTSHFTFNSAANGDLPGDPNVSPPTLVFVSTDPTIAASNGWFSMVGATSMDSTATTYSAANFTGRVMGFGTINFDVNPSGLPSQNQLSLSSKWTSANGGPETIPASATDNSISSIGKIVVAKGDFGGTAGADAIVYALDTYVWYIKGVGNYTFGADGVIPAPGDYNGDGLADVAYYNPADQRWYIQNVGTFNWGRPNGVPVPGDYNGDGTTDIAIYDPANGFWYIRNVGNIKWTVANGVPVPGDYNGDGITELAMYDPGIGYWYIRNVGNYKWYGSGMVLLPADYDGDGTTDMAFYSTANGYWYIKGVGHYKWYGSANMIPSPGDFNGDGITEMAFYEPSNSYWYVKNGTNFKWGGIAKALYLSK